MLSVCLKQKPSRMPNDYRSRVHFVERDERAQSGLGSWWEKECIEFKPAEKIQSSGIVKESTKCY